MLADLLDDFMTITIPVTRILLAWILCLGICAVFKLTKGEAIEGLVVSTLLAMIWPRLE